MQFNSKKVLACSIALSCSLALSGCGDSDHIAELRNIEALNGESEMMNLNMSITEKEAAIYAQVSDRTLLDLSGLDKITANDRSAVISYMNRVDSQLTGAVKAEEGVIDSCYTDYLLMEFEKTPYYWQRSSMNIRGMDAASRSVVVDVTYKTINFKKIVTPASKICLGEPNYEKLLETRFTRWNNLLSKKYGYNQGNEDEIPKLMDEFVEAYGPIEEIFDAQRDYKPTEEVYQKGNQRTYSGMIDFEQEQCGATMTVRFVLVPNYTLGINQGFACKHMYMLDYKLDKDSTEGRSLYNEADAASVADSVYNALQRYYKCLDEDNYIGMYSLTNNFNSLDRAFEDYFETTYRKFDSFTLSIFDISGTRIECGTTVSKKLRTKGSEMSLPIYTDRYYYILELVDGKLQIVQEVLLSSTIEGEPTIDTIEVENTGFSSSVTLTDSDKKHIEDLIANFGCQQLLQDDSSDKFSDIVDMSLSVSQINSLKENMLKFSGKTKATWLLSYLQGQQNYASVKCRELFQEEDGKITEVTCTYDFIYKGGSWKIFDYQINSRTKLDTNELTTKNALCVISNGKIETMNSQVGVSEEVQESGDKVASGIGEIINYKEYTPVIKTAEEKEDEASGKTDEKKDSDKPDEQSSTEPTATDSVTNANNSSSHIQEVDLEA